MTGNPPDSVDCEAAGGAASQHATYDYPRSAAGALSEMPGWCASLPDGSSTTAAGLPTEEITYSGYAEMPCSWRSSPRVSPSAETRSNPVALTRYMSPRATAKVD